MRGALEDRVFIGLLVAVSLAFAWVIQPFFGAVLWGVVAAILFVPLFDRLLREMPKRRGSAAGLTLLVIVALVILPSILLGMQLLQEATGVYAKIQSGQIDVGRQFQQVMDALPNWATSLLARLVAQPVPAHVEEHDATDRLERGDPAGVEPAPA